MEDTTKCEGFFCTERDSCRRFLDGKKSTNLLGWWIKGKDGSEIYRECELILPIS